MIAWIGQGVVAAVVFGVLDWLWLGKIGRPLYDKHLGSMLADKPNMTAALLFYVIFIAGLVHFVIHPAVADGGVPKALLQGAIFGLVTYATWTLTNLAVLEGFPSALVPIDLAWGVVISASTAAATVAVARVVPLLQ
ncbi:DUF2177 family protein [Janibacter sp. GXQ6167]|uniref:DUF2177 family protein n=1 Tax=Janibacter sp. GXQ6167 TaxID=3240791 RepID=UPI00352525CB